MPTKTDRILSYLPGTFRAFPKPTALYFVADAFGNELLKAENSLAAVMSAHWVDHADRGAELVDDLARIAALYGLAPRPDESVEEFREHLKRYIRTFLEGTVTVQGILRVTAETLGLRIADDYEDMDTWWNRADHGLVTTQPLGADAAGLVLGFDSANAKGTRARSAQVTGTVDLGAGVDLSEVNILRIKVDEIGPEDIDLTSGAGDISSVKLSEIVDAINARFEPAVASHDGTYLTLRSPTTGAGSFLEIQDTENDAAQQVLGLLPRVYRGSDATSAQVTGLVDLSGGVDLSAERYIRLAIDGEHLSEIDCAGPNPAQTSLDQVRDLINSAFGMDIARHDGKFLTLKSPTTGFTSSIGFQHPAAQDATEGLFGQVSSLHSGRGSQPARVEGKRDLSRGADLSDRSNIRLGIDDGEPVTINCAGSDPANTGPAEIVAAINAGLGIEVARHDGRFITLSSPTVGNEGAIMVETPAEGDAAEIILGIGSRVLDGTQATKARIIGETDLSDGVDLTARHFLKLSVDGGTPVEIDLRSGASDPHNVTLNELVGAINSSLGAGIASHDSQYLILASPTEGGAGSLTIKPMEKTKSRRFVTRAMITDEASQSIFGFTAHEAYGKPATSARLTGKKDLSRGVDLRENRYLRLAIDGHSPRDIDCAGKRPRATLIDEITKAIKAAFGNDSPFEFAANDGQHLILNSPKSGGESRIAFEQPRATDALDSLLGIEPGTFRGEGATRVSFVGTVNLSEGVDLPANSAIKVGIDNSDPVEIALGDSGPSRKSLNQIVIAINLALGRGIASHEGTHLILTSQKSGNESRITFDIPGGQDVTKDIFGIAPPRAYRGDDAVPAKVIGVRDLSVVPNLSVARFLNLSVDGGPSVEVDCASKATDPESASLGEIVDSINEVLGDEIASHNGLNLILTSKGSGLSGRITIEPHFSGDARGLLFGDVEDEIIGEDPTPATIIGDVDVLSGVDLSQRRLLRLSVDGGDLLDIDVSGSVPASTFLDEIKSAINAVFPDLASATDDDRLRLTSPTVGIDSRLSLLPLRYLELIEYPPQPGDNPVQTVNHGDRWSVVNSGVAQVIAEAQFKAPQGISGPTLVNMTSNWSVRLVRLFGIGEAAQLRSDKNFGLRAEIISAEGKSIPVSGSEILVGPVGAQTFVPFQGKLHLSNYDSVPPSLQLNNPLAPNIVQIRDRQTRKTDKKVTVSVVEHQLTAMDSVSVPGAGGSSQLNGKVIADGEAYRLVDSNGDNVANLKAGPGIDIEAYRNFPVNVLGVLHQENFPLMIVNQIDLIFDVTINYSNRENGKQSEEHYTGVTIGTGSNRPESLAGQIALRPSTLVKAEELNKGAVLNLPKGKSEWLYLDCHASRFNQVEFDSGRFAGGICTDRGVFNVSRFAQDPLLQTQAVFASSAPIPDPPAEVSLNWENHIPGSFVVNLPVDLPARFGGRFNEARFTVGKDKPELFEKVVTEPPDDGFFLVDVINNGKDEHPPSNLVKASVVPFVPLGWEAVEMPFRKPQILTLGGADEPARIYLSEEGLAGFIELRARESGQWGNGIAVAAPKSGPAMYDVSVIYAGARFENARKVILGKDLSDSTYDLPAEIRKLLEPGPIGVLQAKAAGIRVDVARDRAECDC